MTVMKRMADYLSQAKRSSVTVDTGFDAVQEFGQKIAFHGGIDLQQTLPYGTPQEVADEVQDRCRVLGKGGGYICTSAHYIQGDVPVENILSMYLAPRTVE